jgi:hypothetical protein
MQDNILMIELLWNQELQNIFFHDRLNIHYLLDLLMEKVYLLIKVDPKYLVREYLLLHHFQFHYILVLFELLLLYQPVVYIKIIKV